MGDILDKCSNCYISGCKMQIGWSAAHHHVNHRPVRYYVVLVLITIIWTNILKSFLICHTGRFFISFLEPHKRLKKQVSIMQVARNLVLTRLDYGKEYL
jgi:hypothetical protein